MNGNTLEFKRAQGKSEIGAIANSSSPAPRPGRPMSGMVHGMDPRTGMGKIMGKDGSSYTFFKAGVTGGHVLMIGQSVNFIDSDGVATKVDVDGDLRVSDAASSKSGIGAVANSSSPRPGPGRSMAGTVAGYDARTGRGKIIGSDGAGYSFYEAGVVGGASLQTGQAVEFNDNDGIATKISAVRGSASPAGGGIGGLANSSSPAPGPGRAMMGKVQGFDTRTGRGKIKSEDGTTYTFYDAGVLSGGRLQPGDVVFFQDNDGIATKISVKAGAQAPVSFISAVANSSSPAPSAGRAMRGKVVGFDARTGRGKILGEDNVSYSFYGAGVIGGKTLKPGRRVTFTDKDGLAVEIRLIRSRLLRFFWQ